MVIDWLAAGIDPARAVLFIQSRLPEHAELHLALSMCTPLGWLERVPTYKDQQEKLTDRDLTTYGFLGYPLLQAADILMYRAQWVPVGEDQVPHVELTREVARRFNHLFGREAGFEAKAAAAVKKLGGKRGKAYEDYRVRFQQEGDTAALEGARALIAGTQSLSEDDRARLLGWLEGGRRRILVEPQALLTETSKVPGLDGAKMSKSYGNAVAMREDPASVTRKLRQMPTDPARVRRNDPGEPERCPVWQLHQVYSNAAVKDWVQQGCRSAGIGCLDCKQPVIDAIIAEQQVFIERAQLGDGARRIERRARHDGLDQCLRLLDRAATNLFLGVLDDDERDAVLLGRIGLREGDGDAGLFLEPERGSLEDMRERDIAGAVARQHADSGEAVAQPGLELRQFADGALARMAMHHRLDGGVAGPAVWPTQGANAFDFHGSCLVEGKCCAAEGRVQRMRPSPGAAPSSLSICE